MGATKADFFTVEENHIAKMLKALGHPARIAIIEYLMKVNTCISGDIVNELPLAQPTISQHLKELKSAGLIKGTVEGTAICYCIDSEGIEFIKKYFERIFIKINEIKTDCC